MALTSADVNTVVRPDFNVPRRIQLALTSRSRLPPHAHHQGFLSPRRPDERYAADRETVRVSLKAFRTSTIRNGAMQAQVFGHPRG